MTSATLLDEVHQSLAEAMRTGQPFEEWRQEAIRKLEGRWLGRTQGELWDELPPAEKAKRQPPTDSERNQVIKESRLTTIFTTNMLSAYQAGRYQQLQESVEEYPYWRYKSMGDSHVRPAHRALNGKVFRADDPFWASHYPPNGFNCRCSVEPLDDYDLKLDGLKVERGKMRQERDGEGRERSVYVDAEGKSYPTDPGWSYNPGEINGPLKVFSEQKFTPSIQRQVDKDLESIRQLDSDYRSQVERRREAESQERRQLAERLEEARRQAELQAKARAEAAEEEAAKRREQEEREAQRLVAESERQVAQEQKRQAQEEREIEAQAKRQSAQILRREKKEAQRQQEALANLERAAQKERRQEAKARAQEEAIVQRLVERSQKEREEEARRLEETSNERELLRKQMLSESQERLQAQSRELEEAARRGDAQAKARIEAAERLNKFLNKQRQKPNPSEPKIMNAIHEPQARGPASLDPYGRFPNDPYINDYSYPQMMEHYRQHYNPLTPEQLRPLSSYVEGTPSVSNGKPGERAYQAIQRTLRSMSREERRQFLATPLATIEERFGVDSAEAMARGTYETLKNYRIPQGVTLYRNASAYDLLDNFKDPKSGIYMVELLSSALETGDTETIKNSIKELNANLVLDNALPGTSEFSPNNHLSGFVSTCIDSQNEFKADDAPVRSVYTVTGSNVRGVFVPWALKEAGQFNDQKELLFNATTVATLTNVMYLDNHLVLHWEVGEQDEG